MSKTVVHFISGSYLNTDWIYRQICFLCQYEPIVYCFGTKNLDIFPIKHLRSFKIVPHLQKFNPFILISLLRDKPAVIHAHFGMAGYDILHWKILTGIPLITSFYGMDLSLLPKNSLAWRLRYRLLFRFGDTFLVQGQHMKQSLINLGCPAKKITIQYLGVNSNAIEYHPRLIKPGSPCRLLVASRFVEKKGIPDAVSALALLKKTTTRKFIMTIVGDATYDKKQQNEKKKILKAVSDHNLTTSVGFTGSLPYQQFLGELSRNHIFLSPSVTASDGDNEGGSNISILAASASGMPIIATWHCDIPETVINGKSGYLVSEHRPDLIAKKILQLINNPKKIVAMGKFGHNFIQKYFDAIKQSKKQEHIYDRSSW